MAKWHNFNGYWLPDYDAIDDFKNAVDEGVKLLSEGKSLGYNTDSGVGKLVPRDGGYVVSHWCYMVNHIDDDVIDARQAVEWLIHRTAEN